ncbi:MAG: hypothetical protein GY818_05075 [Planctomycetaceae bacterium]|nr:hypothetical protein [Planctomycetaceae bacterium]
MGPYKVLEVIGRNYRINSQPKEKIVNWENTRPFEGRPGLLILGSEDGIDLDWDWKTIPAPGSQSAYSEDAPGQVACPEERAGIEPSERRQYDLRVRGEPQYREDKDDDSFLWSDTNTVDENYADLQVEPGQQERDPGSTASGLDYLGPANGGQEQIEFQNLAQEIAKWKCRTIAQSTKNETFTGQLQS